MNIAQCAYIKINTACWLQVLWSKQSYNHLNIIPQVTLKLSEGQLRRDADSHHAVLISLSTSLYHGDKQKIWTKLNWFISVHPNVERDVANVFFFIFICFHALPVVPSPSRLPDMHSGRTPLLALRRHHLFFFLFWTSIFHASMWMFPFSCFYYTIP